MPSYYNACRVCLSVCQPPLAPYLLHGRRPRPRRLSPWALSTCPHHACTSPHGQPGGVGGCVAKSSFPADSAKPVSLAHHVVLHGGKLPSIRRDASSETTHPQLLIRQAVN